MNILAIDTSSKSASAAIIRDESILAEYYTNVSTTHSQTILPMVNSLLENCGLTCSDIDAFAVTVGPGSFTGLRIGISAVKGMAFVNNRPCVAVSTPESLAYNLRGHGGIICAAMDARCGQVYTAIFSGDGENVTRITEDMAIPITELETLLLPYIDDNIVLVGDGAKLCQRSFTTIKNCPVAAEHVLFQRASSVGAIAVVKLAAGEVTTAGLLSPAYLRLPQAERELKLKQQQ